MDDVEVLAPANGAKVYRTDYQLRWRGYGDPLDRNPDQVAEDVRNEIVSREAARDQYGVILKPASVEVDVPASENLRVELRQPAQDVRRNQLKHAGWRDRSWFERRIA